MLILYFQSSSVSDRQSLQKSYKDGYESDSTLSYRRHQYIPQQSENKSLYTQVQKGGEVPPQGLRMQAPDKKGKDREYIKTCMFSVFSWPHLCSISIHSISFSFTNIQQSHIYHLSIIEMSPKHPHPLKMMHMNQLSQHSSWEGALLRNRRYLINQGY